MSKKRALILMIAGNCLSLAAQMIETTTSQIQAQLNGASDPDRVGIATYQSYRDGT